MFYYKNGQKTPVHYTVEYVKAIQFLGIITHVRSYIKLGIIERYYDSLGWGSSRRSTPYNKIT